MVPPPAAANKPPLDQSHVSRTSSLQSDGWGRRQSTDGYEQQGAPGRTLSDVSAPPPATTTTTTEGWGAPAEMPTDDYYVESAAGGYPQEAHHQTYPPYPSQETNETGQVYADQGATDGGEYGGGASGGYAQEYDTQDHNEHSGYGNNGYGNGGYGNGGYAPAQGPLQPASKRKPPPAIAKESPLKALYAKGAENYDGNRRKVSLSALMDTVAEAPKDEGFEAGQTNEQPAGQYQSEYPSEYPSDYQSEYQSEYPSEYQSEYPSEFAAQADQYPAEVDPSLPSHQGYGAAGYPQGYQQQEYPSEYPSEYQSEQPSQLESTSYPPGRDAGEQANLAGQGAGGSAPQPYPQLYGMPGQGSNQGSSHSFNANDASTSEPQEPWSADGSRQSLDRAGNPALGSQAGRVFQPMNPGSPGGALNPAPPTFDQAKPFVPGQGGPQQQSGLRPQQQGMQAPAAMAPKASKNGRKGKKRMFLFRPFSLFYQLMFVACLVLNPAWTVTRVSVVGAIVQAGVAGFTGMNADAFQSTLAKQYPGNHRVSEYKGSIEAAFALVSGASGDAWATTTAKVPCASASTACILARKALHAGLAAGLLGQRSAMAGYKHVPAMVGHVGGVATDAKTFLASADTWRLDRLRANAVGAGKSTVDMAVCFAKNAIHSSSVFDLTSKAVECGTLSYDAMLTIKDDDGVLGGDDDDGDGVDDGGDDAIDRGVDGHDETNEEEVDADAKPDEELDEYEDPYAAELEAMEAMAARNASDPNSENEPTVHDEADEVPVEDEQGEQEEEQEEEQVAETDTETETETEATEEEAVNLPPVVLEDVPEEPADIPEESFETEPIAPDEIPPLNDEHLPKEVPIDEMPDPIVPETEVPSKRGKVVITPIVTGEDDGKDQADGNDADPGDPDPYLEDYPTQAESPEEIHARAQRRLDHEKKLADRKKRKPAGNSGDLRSALATPGTPTPGDDVPAADDDGEAVATTDPLATIAVSSTMQPFLEMTETLAELVKANMTHIVTAVVSALAASSVFIIQGIRASGAGFNLSALSDLLNALPRTPRRPRRAGRSIDEEDDDRDEAPVPKRTVRSKTPSSRGRKASTTVDSKKKSKAPAGGSASETAATTRRSSRRSASRK